MKDSPDIMHQLLEVIQNIPCFVYDKHVSNLETLPIQTALVLSCNLVQHFSSR